MTTQTQTRTQRIAELNDYCRKHCMIPVFGVKVPCKYMITRGIQELSPVAQIHVAAKVREYDDFSEGNNPYGERDFGAIDYEGHKIFWKIDYYAMDMRNGSEDPADPSQTMRVLTIMLAEEY